MAEQPAKQLPAAKKVEHIMELFRDARIDNYCWLRDENRSNPEVLSYLKEWNAYTDLIIFGTKKFEAKLFVEIKGRIKEDDVTTLLRKGPYYYYEKTLLGKEYVQHCCWPVPESQVVRPHSVEDVMLNGMGTPREHVILDENVTAQGHDYFLIDSFKVSSNHKLVAHAKDTKGDEIYTIHVIDAETGALVGKTLSFVTSYLEWAGDSALVYITMDATLCPDKVWLHKMVLEQSKRQLSLPFTSIWDISVNVCQFPVLESLTYFKIHKFLIVYTYKFLDSAL